MVSYDKKYISDISLEILNNTCVDEIVYINKYDNYYIVIDNEYLYLFDSEYNDIYKIELSMIHKNENNYDLIYRNSTIMYMDSCENNDGVIFKYYDIYSYELLDEVIAGGSYE